MPSPMRTFVGSPRPPAVVVARRTDERRARAGDVWNPLEPQIPAVPLEGLEVTERAVAVVHPLHGVIAVALRAAARQGEVAVVVDVPLGDALDRLIFRGREDRGDG